MAEGQSGVERTHGEWERARTPPRCHTPRALGVLFSLLIATGVLLVPTGDAPPTPGDSVAAASGPGNAYSSALVVDAAGMFHVAFTDAPAGERGVYYARSGDGVAWTSPIRIDAPGASAEFARLAVEREPVGIRGRLYAIYQVGTGSNGDIWFTASDGGTFWSPPRRVDSAAPGVSSLYPSVAASAGRVYAAWSDLRLGAPYYQIFVRVSSDGGATWGAETLASLGGATTALQGRIDAKGDSAVVVWRQTEGGVPSIWSARTDDAGATWRASLVATGSSATDQLRDPDVVLDELGGAHVVWAQRSGTGETHILYAASGDGTAWSAPVRVDDVLGTANAGAPSISLLAGTVWVAWHDNRGGDYDVWASWSEDGRTWGGGLADGLDLRVDDTDRNAIPFDDATHQFNATVRTGGQGVYVAWEDSRNGPQFDVYFGTISVSPLVITEIQDEPSSEARVEVYNFARAPFSMSGVQLYVGPVAYDVSGLGSIPARGHVVVGASTGSDLVLALDLGSEGAALQLRRGNDVLATAGSGPFGIAPDPLPGESASRYAGTLDYASSWTRSASTSFRARNAVPPPDLAPPVVLNEVLFYSTAPSPERFVELRLRGAQPVDLTGYRIVSDAVYTFAGGTATPTNPHAYLFEGRSPGWFAPLTADADNVYLYDSAGRLLDMVGWTTRHAPGATVARAAPGLGGLRAYDDPSALGNGWLFDQAPSLALVALARDQRTTADIGTTVQFSLTATNLQAEPEILNVDSTAAIPWPVSLLAMDGTPLADSPEDTDALPDLGLVGPGVGVSFLVEVRIPLEGIIGDTNAVTVTATPATVPSARASATLTIDLYPHVDAIRTVDPSVVYLAGTGPPFNEVSRITVSITGAGLPVAIEVPQDVVFQIDESGSMCWNGAGNDCGNVRVDAVQTYISGMRTDDRAALIGFTDVAWVVADRPLTYTDALGKAILRNDAETLRCNPNCYGWTNIERAIDLGTNLLITQSDPSRSRVEILLTDGDCQPTPCTDDGIIQRAVDAGIVIYTIGLGQGVNVAYLQSVADRTGGKYYHADAPGDLLWIYEEIGTQLNRTAGVDPDVTDGNPMVEDHVAPYLTILPGSFVDPSTGQPRPPDFIRSLGDRTVLQWNLSRIEIDETWAVEYRVTSSRLGVQDVALYPDARIAYVRWDGSIVFQPIPRGELQVLRAATPPYIELTNPADGAAGVALTQSIAAVFSEDMDWPTVAWSISPPLAVTPSFADRVLTLSHAGLEECTEYTVQVTQGRDAEGEDLVPGPVPNPWRFTTVCPVRVRYTITRIPELGQVLVDGLAYDAPAAFTWIQGEAHRIEAPDVDTLGASRVVFTGWDDLGERSHVVLVGGTDRTITATYAWQHRVDLTLIGLAPGRSAGIRFAVWGAPSTASADARWSEWADDGSLVDVDGEVAGVPGERFVTQDPTSWPVTGPLQRSVFYHHQFRVTLHFLGLEGHAANVSYAAFQRAQTATSTSRWSAWVDAGRTVRADDEIAFGSPPRERFRTFDPTNWSVEGPLEAWVAYLHQFRPRVTLIGLDAAANHTVGVVWHLDREVRGRTGLDREHFEWADAGTPIAFDPVSTGDPPLYAQGPAGFTVSHAFDEVLAYGPAPPPPPEGNWKPLLALAYAIGILAAGAAGSRRLLDHYVPEPADGDRKARKLRWARLPVGHKLRELSLADVELKVHKDRTFTRLLTMVPFAAAEASIGVVSFLTGILRIPESGSWLPLGFWVNTVLLGAGVSLSLAVWRRGYRMTDDALLRLAAVRERMARDRGPGAPPGT